MSIVVNIYYSGTGGNARKFAEGMESSGTVAEIRKEEGNLRYEYFITMADPEALDRHHASPMMEKIAELRVKYDLHMRVERYVSEEGGIPEADSRFVKE